MPTKRKRTVLTVEQKHDILHMIDIGECRKEIAKMYGIGLTTVTDVKTRRREILQFVKTNTASIARSAVVMKSLYIHKDLNRLLRQWYMRCILKDIQVTGEMMQKKAEELNKQLTGKSTSTISIRWVARFRKRHKLRKADIDKELETPNQAAADIFKAEFDKLMQTEGYKLENVYNAETTGLLWKAVPETTLLFTKLKSLEKRNGQVQVTTLLCANATGCHKLPILIIGTRRDPPTINSLYARLLSIMYKTNIKAYMDNDIFNEWFNECFLKSVIERQQKNGHREKTLLLLNNAGLEEENRIISTKDEFVNIMHFSYDAAPLIQPMNRGIIASFKRTYRNELLDSLMPTSNTASALTRGELLHTYSQLKMDNCCRMIHNAWSKVQNPILKNSWNKLLKDESEQSSEEYEIIKKDINEAIEKLNGLPGCEGCDSIAVMNWFETDKRHKTEIQVDVNNTLINFINVTMDTESSEITDENIEDILDDSYS